MIKRAYIFVSCVLFFHCAFAQEFVIPVIKKKDKFSLAIIQLLNDAPNHFKNIKGKPFKQKDDEYPGTALYDCKIKIPGGNNAKLVQDVNLFADYTFGEYADLKTAQSAYVHLANSIGEALNDKVLFTVDTIGVGTIVREIKLAYTRPSGFFHYNMLVQLCKNDDNDSLKLKFKVHAGSPQFYYKINRNEPINSFMFVSAVRGNLENFQRLLNDKNCLGEIPTFTCKGLNKQNDSSIVTYIKCCFQYMPDAVKEFEVNVNNLRTCLSEEYVYYILPANSSRLRQVVFLKFDDVDDIERKVMALALKTTPTNDYHLEMRFIW